MGILQKQIEGLNNNIDETNIRLTELNDLFWDSGGTLNCCHTCFTRGEWDRLQELQETRRKRIKELTDKIKRDSA